MSFQSMEKIYYQVSMIELIANPKQFADSTISTDGFIVYEFEHHAVYLTSESAKHFFFRNGIRLMTDSNTVWGTYRDSKGSKVHKEKIKYGQPAHILGTFKPNQYQRSAERFSGSILVHKIFTDDKWNVLKSPDAFCWNGMTGARLC